MGDYLRPRGLEEALQALTRPFTVLAGGTDFYPARVGRAVTEDVLDIAGIAALRGISETPAGWRLGATTTWSELVEVDLPPLFDGLKQAAREVGGRQIQNSGTIAGNICNASPAADGVPALLALDAEVELASREGARRLPLASFITGVRMTARQPGELVVALHVPRPQAEARSAFLKLGARRYLVISIAMASTLVEVEDGKVKAARVAVGACSPVAQRLPALEQALVGAAVDARLGQRVAPSHLAPLSPIDDVRGSAGYRREVAMVLLRRLLSKVAA
jgi:CO/xanthine dehydrogenase FAD-binding subunit